MADKIDAAIDDSHLLMAYFSRAPITVEGEKDLENFNKYTDSIAAAQTAVRDEKPLTSSQRAEFWKAFIFLSNVASPATIESIRFYFDFYGTRSRGGRFALPNRTKKRHLRSIGLLVCTLATLVLSLIGFIGSRTLEQFSSDHAHWYALVDMARLAAIGEPVEADFDTDGKTLLIGTHAHDAPSNDRPPHVVSGQAISVMDRNNLGVSSMHVFTPLLSIPPEHVLRLRAAMPELLDINHSRDDLVWVPSCEGGGRCVKRGDALLAEEFVFTLGGLQTERHILDTFMWPINFVYNKLSPEIEHKFKPPRPPEGGCKIQDPMQSLQTVANSQPMPNSKPAPSLEPGLSSDQIKQLVNDPIIMGRIFLTILCNKIPMPINLPPPLSSLISMEFKAKLLFGALDNYVLTLLFGFLGALVHVTREINRKLDDFTLTDGQLNRYRARVILGGVSGSFIGLFFSTGGALLTVTGPGAPIGTLTSHLTGVSLAFVAGFSVEVLFAILDRITHTFRDFAYGSDATRAPSSGNGPTPRRVRIQ